MSIFKIFNTRNPIYLQNLNVIYSAILSITLYFIVKKLFKEEIIHKISLIFIAFFSIYFTFFSPHVYGNIPGLMFGLIALLFTLNFIDSNKTWHIIVIAVSITFSYLLKNNYEIFLFAIIIELLLTFLKNLELKPLLGILAICFVVFGTKTIIYNTFERKTNYSLNEGVPVTSYIYMGIAEPVTLAPGWYTGDVENIYIQSGYNKEKSEKITKELMDKRLKYLSNNPRYTADYFYNKLQTTWLNPTFQVFWCSTPSIVLDVAPDYNAYIASQQPIISILSGTAFKIEERIMDIYQIIIFLSASCAFITLCKKSELDKTLLPIVFLGGFLFHLIWETKSIYVLQYYYLLIPYAAYGIYKFFRIIDNLFKKINFKKKNI